MEALTPVLIFDGRYRLFPDGKIYSTSMHKFISPFIQRKQKRITKKVVLTTENNPVFLYIYLLPNTSFLTQTIILTFWPRMMIIPTVMLQICIGVPLVCRDIFAANVVPLSKPLTRYAGCARKSSSAGRNLKTLLWIHYLQKTATLFQCT